MSVAVVGEVSGGFGQLKAACAPKAQVDVELWVSVSKWLIGC